MRMRTLKEAAGLPFPLLLVSQAPLFSWLNLIISISLVLIMHILDRLRFSHDIGHVLLNHSNCAGSLSSSRRVGSEFDSVSDNKIQCEDHNRNKDQ